MRRLCLALVIATCLVLTSSPAHASALIDITFDAPTLCFDLCGLGTPASYAEDGFLFTPTLGHYDLVSAMNIDTYAGSHATLRMTYENGSFDFLGLDVVSVLFRPEGLPVDEVASIRSSAGATLAMSPGMSGTSMTFADPLWRDLTWVEFDIIDPNRDTAQDNFSFDNVRVSTPEPSTMCLLLVGCAIGLVRRHGFSKAPREGFTRETPSGSTL